MKAWQITAPFTIEQRELADNRTLDAQVKVKISKVLITNLERYLFAGENGQFPIIPGRFAYGVAVEVGADSAGINKNDRVYIDGVWACGKCEACSADDSDNCEHLTVAGETHLGYLRDFVVAPCGELFTLPACIDDEEALLIEKIATASAAIDKLDIKKGQHVAVFGGGCTGNLVAQLLIYKQAVPILIDNDEANLECARACGIYYTYKADADLCDNVLSITGGRLVHGSIFITSSKLDTSLPFAVSSKFQNVVFVGYRYKGFTVNTELAFSKNLVIHTISNGHGYTMQAINLLANKALNFTPYKYIHIPVENVGEYFIQNVTPEHLYADSTSENVIIDFINL